MKAVVVYKAGGPEALQYREVPTPEARPGWTLVKVRGVGVNHSEVFTSEGKSPSVSFPRILGIECVGQVERTFNPRLHAGQTVVSIMGEMGARFRRRLRAVRAPARRAGLSGLHIPSVGATGRRPRDLLHRLRVVGKASP